MHRLLSGISAAALQRDSAFGPQLAVVKRSLGASLCPPEAAAVPLPVGVAAARVEAVLTTVFSPEPLSRLFCCCFTQFSSVSVTLTITLCSFGLCSVE